MRILKGPSCDVLPLRVICPSMPCDTISIPHKCFEIPLLPAQFLVRSRLDPRVPDDTARSASTLDLQGISSAIERKINQLTKVNRVPFHPDTPVRPIFTLEPTDGHLDIILSIYYLLHCIVPPIVLNIRV